MNDTAFEYSMDGYNFMNGHQKNTCWNEPRKRLAMSLNMLNMLDAIVSHNKLGGIDGYSITRHIKNE
jgi:hypothetical protein